MEKQLYRITDKAGHWVAGRRIPAVKVQQGGKLVQRPDPDTTLLLSEQEARYELLAGAIELVPAATSTENLSATEGETGDASAPARRLKRR